MGPVRDYRKPVRKLRRLPRDSRLETSLRSRYPGAQLRRAFVEASERMGLYDAEVGDLLIQPKG